MTSKKFTIEIPDLLMQEVQYFRDRMKDEGITFDSDEEYLIDLIHFATEEMDDVMQQIAYKSSIKKWLHKNH